jgi:hypothetical protein
VSIQPNRVIHRIVEQVDRSDWPPLASHILVSADGGEIMRFYRVPTHERYATPLHFWVHALREELQATGQREYLVAAAGQALGRNQTAADWLNELNTFIAEGGRTAAEVLDLAAVDEAPVSVEVYRMLESACRRSSVVADGDSLMAHFWGHGSGASWRSLSIC